MASVFHADPARLVLPSPKATPELLDFVSATYGLRGDGGPARDLGGAFNLNLLIDERVVRVYGPWVTAERVREIQAVRSVLRRRAVPVPELVPALDGSTWCEFGECVVEAERYVRGEPMDSPERLLTGLRTLGGLHAQLADLEPAVPPPIANHLPQELAVEVTYEATALIRSWDPTPLEAHYAGVAEQLADLLRTAELPSQLVHGDFWDNNVLFDGPAVSAVLDLDFAGVRPRVDDLALPLSYHAQSGASQATLRGLVDAYDAGCTVPLSATERRALPFAMARMALFFLQYLRFPDDEAYLRRQREELVDQRGPDCVWWLTAFRDGGMSADTFA